MDVRGDLDVSLVQRAHSLAPQLADKEAQLEDDILTSPWIEILRGMLLRSDVIRRQEHHGKAYVRIILEFLDDSTALVGLLMKNHSVQLKLLEMIRNTKDCPEP